MTKERYQEDRRKKFTLTIEIPCFGKNTEETKKEVMTDLHNQYRLLDFYFKSIKEEK